MSEGLEDVVAARTVLSDVDGVRGRLIIRGASLDALVEKSRYEDVLTLLLEDMIALPTALPEALGEARVRAFQQVESAADHLFILPPVDALRALLATLPDGDDADTALRLIAGTAVFTAAILRRRQGLSPIPPDPALGHAADILRMMTGITPEPDAAAALDRYLVTVADHGLNASTFTARVIASTGAGLLSATLGALGALKGPLHGGAPGPVLDMLDAIGTPSNAAGWIEDALGRGERLMGFGHRIYRVRDPRADSLKGALRLLRERKDGDGGRLPLAEAVEQAALAALRRYKPNRTLETNVEFYTAILLETLGFPREAFTCVFACGRIGGWIAHAREQSLTGRLIRPQSEYVGPRVDEAA
jgi:citrate synthase